MSCCFTTHDSLPLGFLYFSRIKYKTNRHYLHCLKCRANFNISLEFLDLGGGLGISYKNEVPPSPLDLISCLEDKFKNRRERLILEPGRSISANAGVLLTKVEYIKDNFLIVDAAMNDLLRPSLYKAHHDVCNVEDKKDNFKKWTVVGPVCESSDFLAKNASLDVHEDDLIVVKNAGAYGFVMGDSRRLASHKWMRMALCVRWFKQHMRMIGAGWLDQRRKFASFDRAPIEVAVLI